MVEKVMDSESARKFVNDSLDMIWKYGWQDRVVFPYSFPVGIIDIVSDLNDYDNCTEDSKEYLISLANGAVDILNKWEEYELEEDVEIEYNGVVTKTKRSTAEMMTKIGAKILPKKASEKTSKKSEKTLDMDGRCVTVTS